MQPTKKKSKTGDYLVIGLVMAVTCLFLFTDVSRMVTGSLNGITGLSIGEKPRNELPAGEKTAIFAKKTARVENGYKKSLTYFFYEPATPYPEGLKFPLVLVLHGGTGNAYAAQYLTADRMLYAYPAFILVPVLPKAQLWAYPDLKAQTLDSKYGLGDAVALINDLLPKYPIDRSRIYVVGCSDGGTGAFGAARYYPDFFAAAVAISGGWHPQDGAQMTKLPLLVIHGAQDTVFPVAHTSDTVKMIQSYSGPAVYKEYADMGHECPAPRLYSSRLWKWLFAQQRKEEAGN